MAAFDHLWELLAANTRFGARHSRIGPCGSVRNSHYSVLREWPFGSFPVMSLRRSSEPGVGQCLQSSRALRELLGGRRSFLVSCSGQCVCRRRPLTPRVPWSGGLFRLLSVLAYSTESGDGVPAPVCAVQPLENSKASTSIFVLQATKSQR